MKRRSRLSRSRDFDAVYRRGRSVSTRFLVLYTFVRESDEADGPARLGLAVSRKVGGAVERNAVKRRLREAFDRIVQEVDPGRDYVLIVRPGFAEAAASRGADWVLECVREAFAEARSLEEASP